MAANITVTRVEKDSLGEKDVPADAYYGIQTVRAIENFPISGLRFPRRFLRALGHIKQAAAYVNAQLGLLDKDLADVVARAAGEVADGRWDDQFPIDIFQTGSGTSTNMNANEVISNRAIEFLGGNRGTKKPVHPNDHVNMCQSSNDVIPTAIHLAAHTAIGEDLLPALTILASALREKADAFDHIVKVGRTHLQDATPIRLGQEFAGYATMVERGATRLKEAQSGLEELPLGGTAVGTGINTHPDFARLVIERLRESTGGAFREAADHFEAQGSKDAVVAASGALKTLAVSLAKIANDLRWLAAGPRAGLGEIKLPAVQPGSSIMPGKVNPVIAEAVCQVSAQVIGNDATICQAGLGGYFELNLMMPVMAYNLLQSIELLANVAEIFTTKCVQNIEADEERCRQLVERSLITATALAPRIGYDAAASLAKEAYESGRTIREVAEEQGLLSADELDEVLDLRKMTEPGIPGKTT